MKASALRRWLVSPGFSDVYIQGTEGSCLSSTTVGDDSISINWKQGGQPVNEGCSEDHFINRYEAAQQARIAELETEIKLRDANTYTDQKSLEMYKYIDDRLRDVEAQIGAQAVCAIEMRTGNYGRERLKWRCAQQCGFTVSSAWKHGTFGAFLTAQCMVGIKLQLNWDAL